MRRRPTAIAPGRTAGYARSEHSPKPNFADIESFTLTTGLSSETYAEIAQARADGNNARIGGGMHYPSTVAISDAVGEAIAKYVNANAMLRIGPLPPRVT